MKYEYLMQPINKRNSLIDLFKFLFSLLIVALHTDPFLDINQYAHYLFSETLSRLGVPFFAATSGYFMAKADCGRIKKSICKFTKSYVVWSAIYLLFDILYLRRTEAYSLCYLVDVVIINSRAPIWYLLAIIITQIVQLIVVLSVKQPSDRIKVWFALLTSFGVLGAMQFGYGKLFQQFFKFDLGILKGTLFLVLPFFSLGQVLAISPLFNKHLSKKPTAMLLFFGGVFLSEVAFVTVFDLKESNSLLFSMFPLISSCILFCRQPVSLSNKQNAILQMLGSISQYIFYFHFLVMYFFIDFPYTLKYICTIFVSIILSYGIIFIKRKIGDFEGKVHG